MPKLAILVRVASRADYLAGPGIAFSMPFQLPINLLVLNTRVCFEVCIHYTKQCLQKRILQSVSKYSLPYFDALIIFFSSLPNVELRSLNHRLAVLI